MMRNWKIIQNKPKNAAILIVLIFIFIFIFPRLRFSSRHTHKPIDINIIEEHHEVIPYWLRGINNKDIPAEDLKLIHIDAHSDMGVPFYTTDFPINKLPKTDKDIKSLMQSNDVFIAGFSLIGSITDALLIFPSWIETFSEHLQLEVHYGFFKAINNFCECSFDVPFNSDEYICKSFLENETILEINPTECSPLSNIKVNITNETYVFQTLPQLQNIFEKPYILDIDEDFFGCESVGNHLIKLGVMPEHWTYIDSNLENLYCPKNVKQETLFNEYLKECVTNLANNCEGSDVDCNYYKQCRKIMKQPYCMPLSKKSKKGGLKFLLVYLVRRFTKKQLLGISWAGFCFPSTPDTNSFIRTMKLCVSGNYGSNAAVQFYSPTSSETQNRLENLRNILCSLPHPSLITVARSNRDGYVPRSIQREVECKLIDILQYCFNIKYVNYDKNLWNHGQGPC